MNSNITRPNSFQLLRAAPASAPQPDRRFASTEARSGTDTNITVFRKLRELDYLASYTHRGRFYTLPEIAHFDDRGLWSHQDVWFSRYGTPLATVEIFVNQSLQGYYADELADEVHADVQQPLRLLDATSSLASMWTPISLYRHRSRLSL